MTPMSHPPSLIQPSLLSRMNERQVLRAIQAHGPMSRAEVARCSGISAPTASKAVEALVRCGWLEEGDAPELVRGRPGRKLRLPSRSSQVLGLVIDAEQCRVVSAGLDGAVCDDIQEFATPETWGELIETAAARAERLMARPGVRTLGLGISMPGLIDYREQRGILSPNAPVTNSQSPALDLAMRLRLERAVVQESHALCLAERYYGSARGLDNFAMLDATSGVGLGVMSGGQLLTGNRGLAGEIGHITVVAAGRTCGCGNRGCLETVACDSSVAWSLSRKLERRVTVQDLVDLQSVDSSPSSKSLPARVVEEAIEVMVEYLGIGVAAVINLFNPSTVFIHSCLLGASDALFDRLVAAARARTLAPTFADCRIVRARGSKRQGAAAAIIEHLLSGLVPMQMRGEHYLGGALAGATESSAAPKRLCMEEVPA